MRLDGVLKALGAAAAAAPELEKLKTASRGVESIFLKDLLSIMRRSVPKNSLGKAMGSEIYQDMFDQAFADSTSKSGSFGIGKVLYDRLSSSVVRAALAKLAHKPNSAIHVSLSANASANLDIEL